jgi:hypothetical protein
MIVAENILLPKTKLFSIRIAKNESRILKCFHSAYKSQDNAKVTAMRMFAKCYVHINSMNVKLSFLMEPANVL